MTPVANDNTDQLAEALRHRETVHRLVAELEVAQPAEEVARIKEEMLRVASEYEASLQATTLALRAENDQLAAKLRELKERRRST